jgi:2-polyprenyl-3-methyl-5-hydroxy-6-metoxy-1,4-benzoquinol methylase
MASVKEHYDNLLAPLYSWMSGGIEQKLAENHQFFEAHGIRPSKSGLALDMGAGSGFQSIPLSQSGFKVIAMDLSRDLLAELASHAAGLPIVTIEDDLSNVTEHVHQRVELIVCMGDTLTHLTSLQKVSSLIEDANQSLEDDGRLIIGYRDLTVELKGLDRFIVVRSNSERIFTCFLEYEKKHVNVHDIVHEQIGDRWVTKKSVFRKLRISVQWMASCIQKSGFTIEHIDTNRGMTTIIAHK